MIFFTLEVAVCLTINGGVKVKKIKVEEVNEMLKNMLTLEQYIELLQLMIKECESFMDNNRGCSSGFHN